MSRLSLVASLVLALSSLASADRVSAPHVVPPHEFAKPPQGGLVVMPEAALDRATVRAALARARATNFAEFQAYRERDVFPSNTFADRKLNVWRDADGHLCAAATIIDASGQHALVARVAEQTNFIRLADVSQGPLMDWILTSGFTQDEIAMIQEPFQPVYRPQPAPEPSVDAKLRASENARLRGKYAQVTRALVAGEKDSLDRATDQLMKHPQLAHQLIDRS